MRLEPAFRAARVLLRCSLMLPEEDEAPQSDHSVELVTELDSPFPTRRRRIAQVVVIAVMMSAGGLIGLALTEHRRALDEERALEHAQGAQLKDGWKTLGIIAAEEARAVDAQKAAAQPTAVPSAPPAQTSVPAPAPANVVIVNPPVATERRSRGSAAPAVPTVVIPTPDVGTESNRSNTVYVPTPALPDATGTNIPEQNLSNGSTPGSLPNPALPNGASNGVPEIPGQPNGPNTAAPGAPSTSAEPPTGSVPTSPPESGITP